jgi:hypothetical protein
VTEFNDLFDTPISADDIKEALKADLLPIGWHTAAEAKYEQKTVQKGPNVGRPFVRVQATLSGDGVTGRKAFFNASPVYKLDKNGKPDFMYRLFAGLSQAVGGGSTAGEVLSKIDMTPFDLRVNHSKNSQTDELEDNVVAIRPARVA